MTHNPFAARNDADIIGHFRNIEPHDPVPQICGVTPPMGAASLRLPPSYFFAKLEAAGPDLRSSSAPVVSSPPRQSRLPIQSLHP